MKKSITTKMVSRFLALMLSLAFALSCNSVSFAADSSITMSDSGIQPYGSLSGYGHKYDNKNGSFTFSVSGSWSPYGGATIKTDGFSGSTTITVKVYDSNGSCKTTKTLGGNDEKANIAILNVPTGTYKVTYSMSNPSSGTIHVWIY